MKKLLMMFSILFNSGCLSIVEIDEPINYQFRIIEVDGEPMACQKSDNLEKVYKRLKRCK